jgi:hypothetical protein
VAALNSSTKYTMLAAARAAAENVAVRNHQTLFRRVLTLLFR